MNQKKNVLFFCMLFILYNSMQLSFANSSSGRMSYQAVVRDATGQLMSNSPVSVVITIHKGNAASLFVFSETHDVTTNENGMISLVIGTGDYPNGTSLADIDWASDNYFLRSRIDPTGGTNYILESVTQLLNVPYAFYAHKSKNAETAQCAQEAERLTQAISYQDIVDRPVLFSGDYADLKNIPIVSVRDSITHYGFTGDYNELKNIPIINIRDTVQRYKFSGDYNDLTNAPLVNIKDTVDKYSFSGDYNELKNRPKGNNEGDILYWSNATETPRWEVLPMGEEGQFLAISNGKLAWTDPSFANTSTSTYKVGEVYLDSSGKPEGIVFEVSPVGRYAKILSFNEYNDVAWDPLAVEEALEIGYNGPPPILTGSMSADDGLYNNEIIRRIVGWENKYPAFSYSSQDGSDWYLPSQNELLLIYSIKDEINNQINDLIKNGIIDESKKPMDGYNYWSSTESDDFFAYVVAFNKSKIDVGGGETIDIYPGENFEFFKSHICPIRNIRKLSWSEANSKPTEKKYQLGELVYDDITPIGMVYEVSSDGLHGKMISLKSDSLQWSTITNLTVGAIDSENGDNNQNKVEEIGITDYPAFKWASSLGHGWYIPSMDELMKIRMNIEVYNNLLPKSCKLPVSDVYWSSTEADESGSYRLDFKHGGFADISKDLKARVIAIKCF